MSSERKAIDRSLELYLELIRTQPTLSLEFEASITEYYDGAPPVAQPRETLMAARRHLEWFVLERHSPELTSRPAEALLEDWAELLEGDEDSELESMAEFATRALADSFAGIFEVSSVQAGSGAWLRDLAGLDEYPIADEGAARAFVEGDVVLGRIFPLGDGSFHLSTAAGIHRDENLRKALKSDLERTREARSAGKIMRVSQRDIEGMFWMAQSKNGKAEEVAVDPGPEARAFLLENGLDEGSIARLFKALEESPIEPGRLAVGADDVLGSLLDELAFETDIDLGLAREHLLRVWVWHSNPEFAASSSKASASAPEATLAGAAPKGSVHAALEAFDQGRAGGGELEHMFRSLEDELSLERDADDEEDGQPDSAQTGDVDFSEAAGAGCVISQIVDEFLWEAGLHESKERVESYSVLRSLGESATEVCALEDLGAADLLRFTCFWIPEHRLLEDANAARVLLDALEVFCSWCEDSHCVSLSTDFATILKMLRDSLPRIVDANQALGKAALDSDDSGELFWIERLTRKQAHLANAQGDTHDVSLPPQLRSILHEGDALRGRVQIDNSLSVFCCYPPEVRGLMGD